MMDAMEVAAVLRRAAENVGCGLREVVSGGGECPEGSCNGCREASAAWANEAADAIERCALPEGVEWPRYESGELVQIGAMFAEKGTIENVVASVELSDDWFAVHGFDGAIDKYSKGERVKRPAVLAADNEPLEVGQTVWDVLGNRRFKVLGFGSDPKLGEFTVKTVGIDGMSLEGYSKPSDLTHQRPVLDADGVPIKVGDTVWDATTSAGPFTVREIERSDDPDEPEDIVWCGEHAANGFKVWRIAGQLTHTKPEPPDSRQAVVNEIGDEMAARIDLLVSSGRWSDAD